MSSNGNFKKSLFGFRGKDVIDYIESIQKEAADKQQALAAGIAELENKIGAAENLASVKTSENEVLSAELEMLKTKIYEQAVELEVLREESRKNREMHGQIGDIFLEARSNAGQIVDNAKLSATRLEATAAKCADTTVRGIDDTYTELQSLKENMRQVFDDFCRKLVDIGAVLENAKIEINNSTVAHDKIPSGTDPSVVSIDTVNRFA